MYKGIASLHSAGESVQYGGPLLCAGGNFANMPGARARFTAVVAPPLATRFSRAKPRDHSPLATLYLTTRRGKQFNSMLWSASDRTTGATRRDNIFIAPEDAYRLGLRDGDPVVLRAVTNNSGDPDVESKISSPAIFRGTCKIAAIKSGTLQAFWPEANVLIASRLDPASHEPDYNAWVTLEKL
jgi:anaerobic selenocysteine-containing dehydrogenase